jgi:coenzyme F420-reducing hydrogenase gamma subunit
MTQEAQKKDQQIAAISSKKGGKKLVVGWFTFTCSEDSTILFTEILNDHFDEWKDIVEFRYLKALKTKNSMKDLDVAFVEGAISGDSQEEEVKKIRENAKFVVAIGACACTGMPSASRNEFTDAQINERIEWYLSHFDYSDKVKKLEDVIKVDDKVDGCPMNVKIFMEVLTKYLKEFEVA